MDGAGGVRMGAVGAGAGGGAQGTRCGEEGEEEGDARQARTSGASAWCWTTVTLSI